MRDLILTTPKKPEYHARLGKYLARMNQPQAALNAFDKAIALASKGSSFRKRIQTLRDETAAKAAVQAAQG